MAILDMTGNFLTEIISGKSKTSLVNSINNKLGTQGKKLKLLGQLFLDDSCFIFPKTEVGQHTTELK